MTEIAFDELEIKDRTGVRIVNLDEDELVEAFKVTDEEEAKEYWGNLKKRVGKVTSSDEHGIESIRYYFAMKKLTEKYELEGIAVKCYPKWMGKICLGYSILSEEGIVCGCEGDVNNTVSMKILYELSNIPTHNTDLLYPDMKLNTILFSHCGSGAFSIAGNIKDIHLGAVRLADTGVCSMFPAKPGKVTLINMVGRKSTFKMAVTVGEAVKCGMEFPGNPLKVKFKRNVDEINRLIATEGVGHHWIGGYGDMSKELEFFCKLNEIRLINF
jgi:L-fucose isomerase-like protein